jgi:hypothetical protein
MGDKVHVRQLGSCGVVIVTGTDHGLRVHLSSGGQINNLTWRNYHPVGQCDKGGAK